MLFLLLVQLGSLVRLCSMERVASHLALESTARPDTDEQDVFARSAFNRYYYAAYLEARKLLRNTVSRRDQVGHSAAPDMLKEKLRKRFVSLTSSKIRSRAVPQARGEQQKSLAIDAIESLAKLLKEAYKVRCIADYEPEIPVSLDKNTHTQTKLSGHSLKSAREWAQLARKFCMIIQKAWDELNP